jgi:hypothetical protein
VDTQDWPSAFSCDRRSVFREAVLAAYEDAREVYDPDRGFNEQVFGFTVYHLIAHQLARAFEFDPSAWMISTGQGPELHLDGLRIRWNKVGRSSTQPINSSFPRPSAVSAAMGEGNKQLLLWSEATDTSEPPNWFLAHIGNPRDGLIRLNLAAPIGSEGREVVAWDRWISIYDSSQPLVDLPEAPAPGLPIAVPNGPLEIKLLDEPLAGEAIGS